MTILILRQGPGAKSLIACNTCGLEEERLTCTIKKSTLHFCDLECKGEYKPSKYPDYQYRKDRQKECRDAHLKKKDMVPKRCTKCKRLYDGPPGGFPKNRDPDEPEPGVCDSCSQKIPYDVSDCGAGVVM